MKIKYISIPFIAIIILVITLLCFKNLDNTTKNIVCDDKIKVNILISKDTTSNNQVCAELSIENQNDFNINLFNFEYSDSDVNFDIGYEGANIIASGSVFKDKFLVEFDNDIEIEDLVPLLKSKNILLTFNSDAANQNDVITKVKPNILLKTD